MFESDEPGSSTGKATTACRGVETGYRPSAKALASARVVRLRPWPQSGSSWAHISNVESNSGEGTTDRFYVEIEGLEKDVEKPKEQSGKGTGM
ncbi:hypothetical protein ACLOJK_030679 [Asimina triloba]